MTDSKTAKEKSKLTKNSKFKHANNPRKSYHSMQPMRPYYAIDAETGDEYNISTINSEIIRMINYCTQKAEETFNSSIEKLEKIVAEGYVSTGFGTGIARKYSISPDLSDLNDTHLQKFRIAELIRHKVITEGTAYLSNNDPCKNSLTFSNTINLGAVDKQMVVRTIDEKNNILMLDWKCFTKHFVLLFLLPTYCKGISAQDFTNPVVILNDNNTISFYFTWSSVINYRVDSHNVTDKYICLAYDLGVVDVYHACVMTDTGKILAVLHPSKQLKNLNDKRNNLKEQKKCLLKKLDNKFSSTSTIDDKTANQLAQVNCYASKIKRLGKEVARTFGAEIRKMCDKFGVDVAGGEDLTWVSEKCGSSRWNFSDMQSHANCEVHDVGVRHETVSAVDSSNTCPFCGSTDVVHVGRLTHCNSCGREGNRDDWAAIILAIRLAKRWSNKRMKLMNAKRSDDGRVGDCHVA